MQFSCNKDVSLLLKTYYHPPSRDASTRAHDATRPASNLSPLELHPRWKRARIYTIQYLPARYITESSKQRRAGSSVYEAVRKQDGVHGAHVQK